MGKGEQQLDICDVEADLRFKYSYGDTYDIFEPKKITLRTFLI